MEEAGIPVEIKGLLDIKLRSGRSRPRIRHVVFYAEPTEEGLQMLPKSSPDYESAGAAWVSLDEMSGLRLRDSTPYDWALYLAQGGEIRGLEELSSAIARTRTGTGTGTGTRPTTDGPN